MYRDAANIDGTVLDVVRRNKETTCPELIGPNVCCPLMLLTEETNVRWSEETCTFAGLLTKVIGREVS